MSKVEVNTIDTQCGSALQIGDGNTATIGLGKSGDTITVPSGATIVNSGTATGFGGTGETSWDTTVKTTGTFTATAGVGYFLNTTGGVITVNLPVGAAGSSVAMADYANTWQTSNVTVTPNGSEKIGGVAASAYLSTEGQSVTFVYIDGTRGWVNVLDSTSAVGGSSYVAATGGNQPTASGCIVCTNYKIHKFTGPGTFCVSAGSGPLGVVDYLVVAGGGGGADGSGNGGGGGGGGGYRESKVVATSGCWAASPLAAAVSIPVTVQGYPIAVGAGGPTGPQVCGACNGSVSSFSSISSAGGGGSGGNCTTAGKDGGSGGGAGRDSANAGGTGNVPVVSPAQGTPGGESPPTPPGNAGAGGGGGATVAGSAPPAGGGVPSPQEAGGPGGAGATSSIDGTPTARAGGGGGSIYYNNPPLQGVGGAGGGGPAGRNGPPSAAGTAGTVNTGGGGGGGVCGGAGGSGIVIIRYKFQ